MGRAAMARSDRGPSRCRRGARPSVRGPVRGPPCRGAAPPRRAPLPRGGRSRPVRGGTCRFLPRRDQGRQSLPAGGKDRPNPGLCGRHHVEICRPAAIGRLEAPAVGVARGSAGRAVGRWLRAGQVADGVAIGGGLDAGLRFHDQGRWHRSAPCAPLASTAQPPRSGHRERGSPLASKGRRLRPTGSTGRTAGPGARLRLGCDGGLPSLARRRPGIWRRGPGRRASASIGRCEGGRRT